MGTRRLILNIEHEYNSDEDVAVTAAHSPTPAVNMRGRNESAEAGKTKVMAKYAAQSYGVMR